MITTKSLWKLSLPYRKCICIIPLVFLKPRLSGLALRLLLVTFFGRSVSFFSAYFHSKPFLQFPPVDKALALLVLLPCELIRNCKILRIAVQLQPHQFDFPLKTRVANYSFIQRHLILRSEQGPKYDTLTLTGWPCSKKNRLIIIGA